MFQVPWSVAEPREASRTDRNPSTPREEKQGKRAGKCKLRAHALTHVVQKQSGQPRAGDPRVSVRRLVWCLCWGPRESQRERPQGRGVAASPHPASGEETLGGRAPVQGRTPPNASFIGRSLLVTLEAAVFVLGVWMGKLRLAVRKLGNAERGPGGQCLPEPGWARPGTSCSLSTGPLREGSCGDGVRHHGPQTPGPEPRPSTRDWVGPKNTRTWRGTDPGRAVSSRPAPAAAAGTVLAPSRPRAPRMSGGSTKINDLFNDRFWL